jgi:hypothetical protein
LAPDEVEQTSCQNDLSLSRAQIVLYRKFESLGHVPELQESSCRQSLADTLDRQVIVLVQAVAVGLVLEN